ncbi:Cro/CI family transcriptional regulator [Pseudomonas fluorescens group sp. PF-1]|uniref:Cro/CI family transcriptional regulator n=1 Tax=Pseudomonas mohnii TaxID=395600 RepID=UPI0018DC6955|nr:Cro/CI family transcriptional regulator [Pseudomonas mohnii]MBH8611190.1 Cro/Cl family transcriptional regulator [Pseudomonas mohnii]
MKQIPLTELVATKGQAFAAKSLGVSPAAISKAISAERNISVVCNEDGTFEAHELKPFPAQVTPKKSAA